MKLGLADFVQEGRREMVNVTRLYDQHAAWTQGWKDMEAGKRRNLAGLTSCNVNSRKRMFAAARSLRFQLESIAEETGQPTGLESKVLRTLADVAEIMAVARRLLA